MTSLCQQILDTVDRLDHVTYAELQRLDGFLAVEGTPAFAVMHPEFENIVMWTGLTKAAAEALQALQVTRTIHWEPCNPMAYLIDGVTLALPRVKQARSYKKEHWLPVCWRPGPVPEKDLREAEAFRANIMRKR